MASKDRTKLINTNTEHNLPIRASAQSPFKVYQGVEGNFLGLHLELSKKIRKYYTRCTQFGDTIILVEKTKSS